GGVGGVGGGGRGGVGRGVEGLEPGRGSCRGHCGTRWRTSMGRRFRLGCRRRIGGRRRSPQRRNRAREMAPKLALLVPQPSRLALVPAHDRGRHRTGPTCRRNFFALAPSSVLPACCLALPFSFLTSVSGMFGFATGSGTCLPASIMSSSRAAC